MGKVRRKKVFKSRTTSSLSLSRHSKDCGSITFNNEEEIAPLPAEIMDCSSVVNLTSNTSSLESKVGGVDQRWNKIRKKEKRGVKKENWKKKIELITRATKEKEDEEKRKKTVIVGDMQPLANSLPIISTTLTSSKSMPVKQRKRTVSLLNEVEQYHAVLKHPAYQKTPMAVISEHVQNAIASGVL